MKKYLKVLNIFLASVILIYGCENGNVDRPNILLIMADDLGYSDIGCYGSEIATPALDKLAEEGMRFSQFYNTARCCPTRASLLTGLYPHQTGLGRMVTTKPNSEVGPYQGYINDQCVTLGEVLKTAGYSTYMSGKWHVGEFEDQWPKNRGFDKYYGLISGAMNYFDISKSKRKGLERTFLKDGVPYKPPSDEFYATDSFTDEALNFLNEHSYDEKPFFLYLAYTAPHWPLHAYPEDIEKYIGKYNKGWTHLRESRWEKQKELRIVDPAWGISPRDPEAMNWDDVADKERMDLKMAIYAAQIERMDWNINRVIDNLKSKGQLDNTIIMFLSDNGACAEGGPLGFEALGGWDGELGTKDSYASYGRSWSNASNTPFRLHKKWVHEGGISTPFIVRYPEKIKANTITHQVGHVIDIMPTICEIGGAEYPMSYRDNKIIEPEGKSLYPVFKSDTLIADRTIFWEHLKNRAIREGDWKLVSVADGEWELYNIYKDRTEQNNLIVQFPEVAERLRNKYYAWAERCRVNL